MEFAVLGWPPDGPTLQLDYRRFSYAGKFVMSSTGKAVARTIARDGDGDDGGVLAAVAFNEDRTDQSTLWLRYVTVRDDHRGEGLGPQLVRFVTERARDCGYERVKIAVNNPFAYEALYKAGFVYTGDETGVAELVLVAPGDRTDDSYQAGLDRYRDRDLSEAEESFLDRRTGEPPPDVVPVPD